MTIKLTWIGHASFKIEWRNSTIFIDPWKIPPSHPKASIILISHSHYDHFSAEDIEAVSDKSTQLFAPEDVIEASGQGTVIDSNHPVSINDLKIQAIPAYNIGKDFHPRSNNWQGYLIEIDGKKLYYAGDTDATPEMLLLSNLDVAMFPVGGTYTLNGPEAALAANQIKPRLAIPYHWGDIVGKRRNADEFAQLAECQTVILLPGESFEL